VFVFLVPRVLTFDERWAFGRAVGPFVVPLKYTLVRRADYDFGLGIFNLEPAGSVPDFFFFAKSFVFVFYLYHPDPFLLAIVVCT